MLRICHQISDRQIDVRAFIIVMFYLFKLDT